MACGEFFGHEDCNLQYMVSDRVGHKADAESWQRSKDKDYKKKMQKQRKAVGK